MYEREFWQLVDEVIGPALGRSVASDQVLGALMDRTASAALADGVEPRIVWHALCDALDIPEESRWGRGIDRQAPPTRKAP